jgi:very-short-patch-repair endonuclease
MKVLEKLGVEYTFQFPCGIPSDKGRPMWYDFYVPSINTIVEYDGVQHSRPSTLFPGYEGQVLRDQLKNNWAAEAGYNIVRIPHTVRAAHLDAMVTALVNH